MALLSGFGFDDQDVAFYARASLAAFEGEPVPAGWTVIRPYQLALPPGYWDGDYFTDPWSGASAIVLQKGYHVVVSFRGTNDILDAFQYATLLDGTYIDEYTPLLAALAAIMPPQASSSFTGGSLGGAAVNETAAIADTAFGGRYAAADYIAYASPEIRDRAGLLNVGFENDPIYRLLESYAASPSSLDHLVLATPEYMAGNFDGRNPLDYGAHGADPSIEALTRLQDSAFQRFMTPDSVVVFDAASGLVTDMDPARAATGAFYLGQSAGDILAGRAGDDRIEGFGGNDFLSGRGGADWLDGGAGIDTLAGGLGNDVYLYGPGDVIRELAGQGTDTLVTGVTLGLAPNVEVLRLASTAGGIAGYGNAAANVLYGNEAGNHVNGAAGADIMAGGGGNDSYVVDAAGDRVIEASGGGFDRAWSSVSWTLPDHVEALSLQGSAAINGTGNAGSNVLGGNAGDNRLGGYGGNDTLLGGAGDDVLAGGAGNDRLDGGAGIDVFLFTVRPGATAGVDVVVGFSALDDRVALENAAFGSLGAPGALDPAAFRAGAGATAAATADQRVVYDTATGTLYHDADGAGGQAATAFAILAGRPVLTAADLFVI